MLIEMAQSDLETELERQVLRQYALPVAPTNWLSHDAVGPDDVVHYFSRGDQKYALVWSDFPNATFIHEEGLTPVPVFGKNDEWLHVPEGELAGYFSLYEDY